MKFVSLDLDGCKAFIADHLTFGVLSAVEFGANGQAAAVLVPAIRLTITS